MIYVITVGEYENTYIHLVTTSLDLAVKTILKQSSEDASWFEKFNGMECWKDNELVLDYAPYKNAVLTYSELRNEIINLLTQKSI